jgi:putative tryptophan/tyrosine transport system substrate-binding protein
MSMKRREFITLLGGAAATWPLVARAQQGSRMRRIGVLMQFAENDPVAMAQLSGFMQGLAELGWTDGRNLRMDLRWAAGSVDRARMFAKELVDLQPDVILAHTTPATAALQRETRTIPIVFAVVSDPVGVKWLELLTEIAPGVNYVQSRHVSLRQIILPALIRGSVPIGQGRADRGARS